MGGQKICCFGAPWPPMRKPLILRQLDSEDLIQADQYENIYANVQALLQKLGPGPCDMTFEEFLAELGINESVYILAIQSSIHKPKVFIKCNVRDTHINAYMKHL